ncbi:hypothetical protein FKM82_020018 [Ascaphus truei]
MSRVVRALALLIRDDVMRMLVKAYLCWMCLVRLRHQQWTSHLLDDAMAITFQALHSWERHFVDDIISRVQFQCCMMS